MHSRIEASPVPLPSPFASMMETGNPPYSCVTHDVEETMQLAEMLAPHVQPGELVMLSGELGAGKTHFVRGFCKGLGLRELYQVDSPTYTIVNHYDVGAGVDHLDLYRLSGDDDFEEIALESMFASTTIKLIEWPERLTSEHLPAGYLVRIRIRDEQTRELSISRLPGSQS